MEIKENEDVMQTIAEYNNAKKKLMDLDQRVLVDALLQLALESSSASLLVTGLIATEEERIVLFRNYVERVTLEANSLTGETILEILSRALDLFDSISMDPKIGLQLLEAFYSTDSIAFESTTKLDFEFDCLFSEKAYNLFCEFAERCSDKKYVQQIVNSILSTDGYGVRAKLNQLLFR